MKRISIDHSQEDETWLQVWREAGPRLGRVGEYDRNSKTLEVWGQYERGGSIEVSTARKEWPNIAANIQGRSFSIGLIGVRLDAADPTDSPGITIAVESPNGGSTGARILMRILNSLGIGGVLANEEGSGRWGVVKILYSPNWYSLMGDKTFGVDWSRRDGSPGGEDARKRIWCEHVVLAMEQVIKEVPSALIGSIFFDCYAICDRLHQMSNEALGELAETKPAALSGRLIAHQSEE